MEYCNYFIIVIFLCSHSVSGIQTGYVTASSSISCPGQPCLTLEDYLQNQSAYFSHDLIMKFLPGDHQMSANAEIMNLIWFSLLGTDATILCNTTGYFAFTNVLNVEILGLQFISCGSDKMLGGVISVRNAINLTLFDIAFSKLTSHGLYVHSVQLLKGERITVQNVESNTSNLMNINYANGSLSNIVATNNTASSIIVIEHSNLHIMGSINVTKNIATARSPLTIK